MKFRLPFQIYRTGVISRSSSPGKILNKFSKDNEAKVRKKTSKINSSYRAIISNYIYSLTRLPLKITMSKIRNRTKLRSSTRSRKTNNIRNEFVFLQEQPKDNFKQKKAKTDKVTNETSECCMNSTKCANFMCAKSTAKILLQQKDLLCNKNSKKCMTASPEEEKPKENKHPKNGITKSANVEKENKGTINTINTINTPPPPLKKIEKPVEMPIKEKHKPNEYKWKFSKSEAVASSSELKRLKRRLHSSDENRNYKIEEAPATPIRMDNIMGAPHFPKKLPELPIQAMPKVKQVRPKEAPSLVAPKRKYDAPEMTRNYKTIENVSHSPPRMDNLVGCKTEPKDKSSEVKGIHENYMLNSKESANKSNQVTKGKKDEKHSDPIDFKPLIKNKSVIDVNKKIPIGDEKDAFLFKLDQVVSDLMPKTKRQSRNLQQLNAANINVSERIKKFEEIIKNNYGQHRSKSEEVKSRLVEDKILTQGKQPERRDHGILSPKLSPFAIAEIRRKYYPSDTFEKERPKLSIPVKADLLIDENDIRADTKLRHLYSRPKEQYKKLDEKILDINPTGNIKERHSKIKKIITCNSGVEKRKDILTFDVDNSLTDSLGDCSTIETSRTNVVTQKVLIPPPSKAATAPENKRNYSSTAIYEYKEAFNVCGDLFNNPINFICSNLCENGPIVERKVSTNIKKCGEINSEVSRAKKRNRIESNNVMQDLDNVQQDRRFSTDVLNRNLEDHNDNTRELNKCYISNSNSNLNHTSQRNLSKRHCTIKVTSTFDNQDNAVSNTTGRTDKLTRQLSYQYYHEQCTVSKNVNDFDMPMISIPANSLNEQSSATLELSTNDVITNERCIKILNEKTPLNKYIKLKMQLQKFASSTKKSSKTSKCCLNSANRIDKQNKYRLKKHKTIQRKQKNISNNNTLSVQQTQKDSINNTVDIIKSQVAQKCVMFDKISSALLKKTDIINYSNLANKELQQKEEKLEYLRRNKKRKLSLVPMLDNPPKSKISKVPEMKKNMPVLETRKIIPVLELKKTIPEMKKNIAISKTKKCIPIPEAKNVIAVPEEKNVNPIPDTRNVIEYMKVDIPPLKKVTMGSSRSRVEEAINRRKTQIFSIKLKSPKPPSREASHLETIRTNKASYLQHTMKIKPPAVPATMKAKRFLAKIEAEPKQIGNILIKKIDKKLKCQKSIKTKLLNNDMIGKYIAI